MFPASLVTLATFLLDLSSSSAVYSMQPAFITANIGSSNGRNIRNLPCVSRKNNALTGVCMFAIDCLKANGTHLGTCIDRFYFGSCCHVEPHHDIVDNSIDTEIIDVREPPERLHNTTLALLGNSSTTSNESTSTQIPFETKKPTFTVSNGIITRINSTVATPGSGTTTPTPDKLQTFQMVNGEATTLKIPSTTTVKISKPPKTTAVPSKPSTASRPKPTTAKPSPTSPSKPTKTTKPTPKPTKPSKTSTTTKKPYTTTSRSTTSKKPTTTKPTKKYTRPSTITTVFTTKTPLNTTRKPTTPTKTTSIPFSTVSGQSSTAAIPNVTQPPLTQQNVSVVTNLTSGVVVETAGILTVTNANSTVSTTTFKPALVTWTLEDSKNETVQAANGTQNNVTQGWIPLTTPDGWVLLPSVTPLTPASGNESLTSNVNQSYSTTTAISSTVSPETTSASGVSTFPWPTLTPSQEGATEAMETTTDKEKTTTSIPAVGGSTDGGTTMMTTSGAAANVSTEEPLPKPVNMSDFTDVCGRRMYPEARIVGGEKSTFGRWPWQISLRQWRTSTYLHKCGAALLNENWAITAAHCVDNVPPSDLLLRLGEYDLSTEGEPYLHQERRVQIVASHPQFDPSTFEYDLALLRFYEPVHFQPNILPVCVPKSDENFVGRTAHVTGWGRLYEDGPLPSVLQEVSVPIINNSVCESMYRSAGYIEHIPHIFICAGWRRGGFDSCEGDSGGPMVIQRDDKRFQLAGIISWGIGCAEPNQPGVYTRISEFKDWINQILQF
ncbi:serine proteinase stubble isoform X2 [Cylas formicarius]|uniref:serine proteinase stubble isoform X2 n=1 Tax=Cylas formicarius TaxID=197179 RepID=UPI002958DE4B|nr:serine proteinase stubble isoform X2 [Cylas formicarius]